MTEPSAKRVSYLRRLFTVALALGIIIATFDVLSKGEQFFVPLVMAVLAVYLVDILSRLIRKIQIAGHSVPNAVSVILAFGIIFGLGFVLIAYESDYRVAVWVGASGSLSTMFSFSFAGSLPIRSLFSW